MESRRNGPQLSSRHDDDDLTFAPALPNFNEGLMPLLSTLYLLPVLSLTVKH